MKLVSFDVGIKNMAYCIFEIGIREDSPFFEISSWNVINLMDKNSDCNTDNKCNCALQEKTTRNKRQKSDSVPISSPKLCDKQAKYFIGDNFFCEKHAKASKYIMFSKDYMQTSLKKLKNIDLITICKKHFLYKNDAGILVENLTKPNLLSLLETFFEKNMLSVIKKEKKESATEVNLITIGRNMRKELEKIEELKNVSHVIIENQISPIANRMKTIQGMLAQYFIMKENGEDSTIIDFISSINKLKGYNLDSSSSQNEKTKYKQHKNDGVLICSEFLNNNSSISKWRPLLETQKKDDLADCFLQGIWYLKSKNIISNANDLKITNL